MAISPLAPASLAMVPAAAPALPAEPPPEAAVSVTPAAATLDNGAAGDAASREGAMTDKLPLEKALEEINSQLQAWSTQLQFEIDPDVHQVVVSVVDAETGDVLRTIPSDAVIRIAKMIVKLQGKAVETTA